MFDHSQNIINVTSPQTTLDVQDLIDAIRDEEDSERGVIYPQIASASGKESLGGGVVVGITVELLNDWQLKFWSGNYIAKISGGNLVGGLAGDPVAYSAGVQVLLIQSAASTVVNVGGSALLAEESEKLDFIHKTVLNKRVRDQNSGEITLYEADKTTPAQIWDSVTQNGEITEIDPQ